MTLARPRAGAAIVYGHVAIVAVSVIVSVVATMAVPDDAMVPLGWHFGFERDYVPKGEALLGWVGFGVVSLLPLMVVPVARRTLRLHVLLAGYAAVLLVLQVAAVAAFRSPGA